MNRLLPTIRALCKRRELWLVLPVLLGATVCAGAWQWQQNQAEAASRWRGRAERCAAVGQSVKRLRQKPQLYDKRVLQASRLATAIESAASEAGMAKRHIDAIRPEPPTRIKQTPYVETFTRVRLRNVRLRELTALIWHLRGAVTGLSIPELRVWATGRNADRWQAELGLAGLAYVPSNNEASRPTSDQG